MSWCAPQFRFLVAAASAVAILLAPSSAAAARHNLGNWNPDQQRLVVRDGLMKRVSGGFNGARPVTPAEMRATLAAMAAHALARPEQYSLANIPAQHVRVPNTTITMAVFDRLLVAQMGLADVARHVQDEAARAGLNPPERFGTEVIIRQLRMHYMHPIADERLDPYPTDPITRAEAAFTLAQFTQTYDVDIVDTREKFMAFVLPHYTAPQREVLRLAVSKIGMPWINGGISDTPNSRWGRQVRGGYDCSGFLWRVYKVSGNRYGRKIHGRTVAQMAGEIPKSHRLHLDQIRAGDLLFFGTVPFNGRSIEPNPRDDLSGMFHSAIAMAPRWAIQSSYQGVFVSPIVKDDWRNLFGWFAWGRRVLP